MRCSKCEHPVRCRGLCKRHYEKSRRLLNFTTVFVDAAETREHVLRLMDAGMGSHRISELSGVGRNAVREILYGRRGRQPSARIVERNALALLAVKPQLAPGQTVDATGSRRRLQALMAIGYTQTELAQRLGMTVTNLNPLFYSQRLVTVRRAEQIAELYERLSMTPGRSERSRGHARKRRWVSPLAWDDDTIDDPNAKPDKGTRVSVRFDDRYHELRALGYSDLEIYGRLNIRPDSLLRQLDRYHITPSRELVAAAGADKWRRR